MIHKHLADLSPSPTLHINEKSKELMRSGKKVFRFGFGQSPFPIPQIVVDELIKNADQKDYLPVNGLTALRQRIAEHTIGILNTYQCNAENVIIGPGSKELMFLAQSALDLPLLLPNPSWVSYAPQAEIIKKDVYWIDTDKQWKIDPEKLSETLTINQLSGGLLILNYPSNPTGQTYNLKELKNLAEVCRRHRMIVLSDEIYGLTNFDGNYCSIAEIYPEGTIISSGLSKWCGAGGWRFGYFILPQELFNLKNTILSLASETFSAVHAPTQYAAIVAYEDRLELKLYRQRTVKILSVIASYCYNRFIQMNVTVLPAKGGFYLFPDFSTYREALQSADIYTSDQMCARMIQDRGIALLPGSAFGRPQEEYTARFSFVDFDGSVVLKALEQDKNILEKDFNQLFPNIVDGMDNIGTWINELSTSMLTQKTQINSCE